MAATEDAATVLEQFIHDVANLPAEIAHLYEEMNAKQDQINECNLLIARKDGEIQQWVKQNTSLRAHPQEASLSQQIRDAYSKAQALQDEKITLSAKACSLMERYVRRLDIKIRDLQSEGAIPLDGSLPSLLRSSPGNLVPTTIENGGRTTEGHTPLQPISANALAGAAAAAAAAHSHGHSGTASIAHVAALNRLAASNAGMMLSRGGAAPGTVAAQIQQAAALANAQAQQMHTTIGGGTPRAATAAAAGVAVQREGSQGPESKRRRLNASTGPGGNLPAGVTATPTNVTRHSSLGPGSSRAGTPVGSRAGSVGPGGRPVLKKTASTLKRGSAPLAQQLAARGTGPLKKGMKKKGGRRGLGGGSRASPSTTTGGSASEESDSEDDTSSAYTAPATATGDHPRGANGDMEDEGSDNTKYCYCHDVSHGDMIACDNADCNIQWFHWNCAGITSEPQGEWLCRDCRKLPRDKIRKQT